MLTLAWKMWIEFVRLYLVVSISCEMIRRNRMNVMLTSVGRRAYMVKYFKEVLGNGGKVFVCNSDDKSIAFKYADEK